MAAKSAYQKFDEIMEAAPKEPPAGGYKAIVERLSEYATHLPQFPAISAMNPGQHITWCKKALNTELTISLLDRRVKPGVDVEEAAEQEDYKNAWQKCLWHLRRASGFGGSEIGTIVLNMSRDENGDFGSAHNTVKEKLLLMAPQIGEPAMRRGHHMEEYVRGIHHQSSGEVEDISSLNALRGFRSEKNPYIIGTPDDITLRGDGINTKKERVLLDYKCPGEEILEKYKKSGVPFGYVAQLHHYLIVAREAGIKINALQLVPFDYKGGANTMIMPVKHDAALEEEIKNTADEVWNLYVMRGRIPEPRKAPELIVNSAELGDAMRKAGVMHAIADLMGKRAAEMKEEAIQMADLTVEKNALGRIDAGFYFISRDAEWNEEQLRELAARAQIDADAYLVPSEGKVNQKAAAAMMRDISEKMGKPGAGKDIHKILTDGIKDSQVMVLDCDRLARDVRSAGVDISNCYKVKERAGLTMKRKGPEAEEKSIVLENAAGMIEEIVQMIHVQIENFVGENFEDDTPEPGESISF